MYQNFAKDDLYIGTDIGVFHKDSTMTEWQLFNNNLPHVVVKELEIQYINGKIRAATFGRGVWESDLNLFPTNIEAINESFINIYPNPTKYSFNVNTGYRIKNLTLNLYNVSGKLVFTKKLEKLDENAAGFILQGFLDYLNK